jgi:hypothetical protein
LKKTDTKKKNDVILIVLIVLIAGLLMLWISLSRKEGQKVVISVDTEVVKELSLNKDQEYLVELDNGGWNRVIIQDGICWVEEANCPTQDCVSMGQISMTGQSIICLPHKVLVQIQE